MDNMDSMDVLKRPLRPYHINSIYAGIAANAALVLIGVACTLLDRQLATQAKAFTDDGGFTERLYRLRTESRRRR